ncbi:unnamed protein product [Cunninghamella blakesleeana]
MHLYNVLLLILSIYLLIQNNNAIELSPSFIINQHEIKPRAPDTSTTSTNNNNNAISTTISHPVTTTTTQPASIQPTSTATTTVTATATDSPFTPKKITVSETIRLEFKCSLNMTDPYFCNIVQNSTVEAIKEIDKVLLLSTAIIIEVAYFSFCEPPKYCTTDSFGRGIPTEQFTFPYKDGVNFVYSQALTKQIYPSNYSKYKPTDISIEINHDKYMEHVNLEKAQSLGWNGTGVPPTGVYWFANDNRYNQTSIDDYQIDMEYIILHQIIHGLGFVSAWAPYFWTSTSPFKDLVSNMTKPEEIQIVTPAMYWYIDSNSQSNGGPLYITGFRPTMIFDKFLYSVNTSSTSSPPTLSNLTTIGLDVQDYCVDNIDSFILNFLIGFSTTPQHQEARTLWNTMGIEESLYFIFEHQRKYYQTDPFLRNYTQMALLTGTSFMDITIEQYDEASNRPGATIFHLDNKYNTTVDFLMTQNYFRGQTLDELTQEAYQTIPTIYYNRTVSPTNDTNITLTYQSPVGPGILHILDSIGYATVLSNVTNSLILKSDNSSDDNSNLSKEANRCDDINSAPPTPKAPSSPSSSHCNTIQLPFYSFTVLSIIILSFSTHLL